MFPTDPGARWRIRQTLVAIILATLPCYCIGLFAANMAPNRGIIPTFTLTPTFTQTATATETTTPQPTETGEPTATETPTLIPTETETQLPPTETATDTQEPSATFTDAPPTATDTLIPTEAPVEPEITATSEITETASLDGFPLLFTQHELFTP